MDPLFSRINQQKNLPWFAGTVFRYRTSKFRYLARDVVGSFLTQTEERARAEEHVVGLEVMEAPQRIALAVE